MRPMLFVPSRAGSSRPALLPVVFAHGDPPTSVEVHTDGRAAAARLHPWRTVAVEALQLHLP